MLPLVGMAVGAAVRYLPNLFGFVGDQVAKKAEAAREAEMVRLQMELEKVKQQGAVETARVSAESAEALATIQGTLEELRTSLADRQSAREYGAKLHGAMVRALAAGAKLGVWRWLLSLGWLLVLTVEALSAAIQPLIAVCAFGIWAGWKISLFAHAVDLTGGAAAIAAALGAVWTENDWLLMDSVIGFFLAGRAQRYLDSRPREKPA